MAMPARKLELETPVEDRLGKIESDVAHMQRDISDLKVDVRRLNDKIDSLDQKLCGKIEAGGGKTDEVDKRLSEKIDVLDQRLSAKIDEVDKRLGGKIDEVDKRLTGKIDSLKDSIEKEFRKLDRERMYDRVWFLLIAGAILGVMAHGLKWF